MQLMMESVYFFQITETHSFQNVNPAHQNKGCCAARHDCLVQRHMANFITGKSADEKQAWCARSQRLAAALCVNAAHHERSVLRAMTNFKHYRRSASPISASAQTASLQCQQSMLVVDWHVISASYDLIKHVTVCVTHLQSSRCKERMTPTSTSRDSVN